MDPSSSSTVARVRQNTTQAPAPVRSVNAHTVDQSHGHTYIADHGGKIEIHTGARITTNFNPQNAPAEELPPLPYCPAPCSGYVQRKALEDHMSSYFFEPGHDGDRRKRYVLHGLGGSGKTQGALDFIHKYYYSLEPGERMFSEAYWVDATRVETITKSLEDIALSVGGSTAEYALNLLASHNSKSNWIMLYNNADDPSLDLTNYFPKCTHGNIIVTTHNRQAARYGLGSGSDYTVSGMEPDEAKKLLISQARLFDMNPVTIQVVDQLIIELDYFALSVRQAGAYIFTMSCTPTEYLNMFRTRRKQLLRKHDEVNAEDYQFGTVEAALSLSFAELSPEALRLLQLFAGLHREFILEKIFRDGFSGLRHYKRCYRRLATKEEKSTIASMNQFREKLITGGRWDVNKFRGLLTKLKSFSLVISSPDQQIYFIHPIVQERTRSAIGKPTQMLTRRCATILLGSAIIMNGIDTHEELLFLRGVTPHVDEVLKQDREIFGGCKKKFGDLYKSVGRWSTENDLREGYDEVCQKILGQQHVKSLTSMHDFARSQFKQGNYEKAAEIQSKALEIWQVNFGIDHPETLHLTDDLASTYRLQGRYEKAAEMQSEVLEIKKVKLGVDHSSTLTTMGNLASAYRSQGQYEKAAKMQSEALEIEKVKLGVDHLSTLTSMTNLALTYFSQGNYEKAAEIQSEVLEIEKVKLGVDHPTTLISMDNLASTYYSQGSYEKAAEMQSEVLEVEKVKLGVDHPDTLISMNNLASTYKSQGEYPKAAEMHSEVLGICKVKLGVDHPSTLVSMNNLAMTYYSQGKPEKAAKMLSEVLEIEKVKFGVDHPVTLTSMSNLASTYRSQGNYVKAAEMESEVLEIRKVKLGVDHPDTLTSMSNLALAYRSQGNFAKAAEMQSEVLEIRKVKLGVDHPTTLISMGNLAVVHWESKNLSKAAEIFTQLIEIQTVRFGVDHFESQQHIQALELVLEQRYGSMILSESVSEAQAAEGPSINVSTPSLGTTHQELPVSLTPPMTAKLMAMDYPDTPEHNPHLNLDTQAQIPGPSTLIVGCNMCLVCRSTFVSAPTLNLV